MPILRREPTAPCIWSTASSCRSERRTPEYPALQHQHSLVHGRDLLAQLEDAVLPVALGVEPWEGRGKRWVIPAARQPRRIMNEPQRTQGLDQPQLTVVEILKVFVTAHDRTQLPLHIAAIAGKQHPQILNGGTHPGIVEIDKMRTGIGPEDIAGVAIAVQAQGPHRAGPLETVPDAVQRQRDYAFPRVGDVGRDEVVRKQPVARLLAESCYIERGPLYKRPDGANTMDTPDEAAHPFQRRPILELGSASSAPRIDREAKAAKRRHGGFSGQLKRCDDGYLELCQLGNERVLFGDLRVAPSQWPVELGDNRRCEHRQPGRRRTVVEPYLIDAILVAVKRQ